MNYRADIDVLRAFAVMLVIIYHANIGVFTGGFIGVDIFFVISGFLMTNIIVKGLKNDDFSLISFYGSRTRRVYPALLVFVVVALVAAFFSLMYFDNFSGQINLSRKVLFGTSNVYFYNNTGYFDVASNLHIFLHTWSLSVEIQFYLLYPLLLIAGYKYLKLKFEYLVLSLFFVSLFLSIYLLRVDPGAAFYLLPARIWEFMVGGLAAVYKLTPSNQKVKQLFVWLGLLLIIATSLLYNSAFHPPFPGEHAILPCLGTLLFISGANGLQINGFLKYVLFNPAVLFIGMLSYSLYLWHWFVLLFYKYLNRVFELQPSDFMLCLALTFLLAYLSWRFVERPFRLSFAKRELKVQVAALLASVAMIASFGSALKRVDYIFFNDRQKSYLDVLSRKNLSGGDVNLIGDKEAKPSFLVIGDSHAEALYFMLEEKARADNVSGHIISIYKRLVNSYRPIEEDKEFISFIGPFVETEKYDKVYFVMRWNMYVKGYIENELGTLKNDDKMLIRYKNDDRRYIGAPALKAGLQDTMRYLQEKGVRQVCLLLPVPENEFFVPQHAAIMSIKHSEAEINEALGVSCSTYEERNKEVIQVFNEIEQEFPFVTLLDPRPLLINEGKTGYKVVNDGKSLYYDDDHLSHFGAQAIAPLFTFRP